ncbi:MAG: DNA topoisomerase IV subunit A [Sphingomonadales bacterium]
MTTDLLPADDIREVPFAKALGERYLSYALSTIMSRSLPDVRDGLKPVHRRLLHAMRQLKLDPTSGYKKSARVVGDVIGKFHPHGDQAIYDAMVRLAQDFSVRFPLIDGQGNFGNIDGDNAAAMRYTEARMTEVADVMLRDIDEDTVDFKPTYDGEETEPVVLPGYFPNLLANGSTGIAVGMATSIPPHNVGEICSALLHLIENPDASVPELVRHIPGPDFPTGGVLVEPRDSIRKAYATGKGGFRLRARWEIENYGRGQYRIVVTEIPFQVQKSRLVEKIAELITSRKNALLSDVRDESTEEVRLVLEPKSRTVDAEVLMASMFKLTDLETRVSLNMNVLDHGQTPRVMNLRDVLKAFLDHRVEVLTRHTRYRLGKIEERLEILAGLLVAFLNLDEVIRIVRFEEKPKLALIERFDLTENQADAILNMRLRALHKLQEVEIRREHGELETERTELRGLLGSKDRQRKAVAEGVREIATRFGGKTTLGRRHTGFADAPAVMEIPIEAMIEREPVTVICSQKGWIRAAKGHLSPEIEIKYKEGDQGRFHIHAYTTDKLLLFATNGRFYTIGCDKLAGGRGHGEPVRLLIDLGNDEEIVSLTVHRPGSRLVVAGTSGKGFIVEADKVIAATRNGKQVFNAGAGTVANICVPADGDHVAVVGTNRKLLVFPLDELPTMSRGQGVVLQRFAKGRFSDFKIFTLAEGLSWPMGSRTRTITELYDWKGKRGGAGRLAPKGFPQNNKFGD